MIIIETILKILKAFRKSNIIETIIAMQAALLSVIVLLQVSSHRIFSTCWREASRFLLIWIVLLGAAIGIKRKSHFTVDIFFKKLPPKLQQSLQFALDIFLFILIFDVMIINGVYLSHLTLRQISPALHIRMSYVYSAVLVGGILSCCYILEDILTHIKEGITKNQNRIIEKGS